MGDPESLAAQCQTTFFLGCDMFLADTCFAFPVYVDLEKLATLEGSGDIPGTFSHKDCQRVHGRGGRPG